MSVARCSGVKMNKKDTENDIKRQKAHDMKVNIKRIWICVAILIPVFIILTYVFSLVPLPVWLIMLLNVIIGGLICLLVYIISDRIEQRRKTKEILDPDNDDPFSD